MENGNQKQKYNNWIDFHSDRGVQYINNKFANVLESYKITRSMSGKGNCWDNAVAESFFKSLKTELIYGNKLITKEQMKLLKFLNILKFGTIKKDDIWL